MSQTTSTPNTPSPRDFNPQLSTFNMEEVVLPVKLIAEKSKNPPELTNDFLTYTITLDPNFEEDKATFRMPKFEQGTYEEYLLWRQTFQELRDVKTWVGAEAKDLGPILFRNVSMLLKGPMKRKWERAMIDVSKSQKRDLASFEAALLLLSEYTLPCNSAKHQKAFLNDVTKPLEMPAATFIQRLRAMNDLIPYMSGTTEAERTKLSDEMLKKAVEKAVPESWNNAFMFERKKLGKNYETYNLHDLEVFYTILEQGSVNFMTKEKS